MLIRFCNDTVGEGRELRGKRLKVRISPKRNPDSFNQLIPF